VYHGGISIDFNWRNFLELARELEKENDEAKIRSSISRAYYAAYCSTRNYMENSCGRALPFDEPTHQYVIDYFSGKKGVRATPRRLKIAQNLIRMRQKRRIADYNNNVHAVVNLRSDAILVIGLSDDVITSTETSWL
jgi:hypothetical protein